MGHERWGSAFRTRAARELAWLGASARLGAPGAHPNPFGWHVAPAVAAAAGRPPP